MESCSSAAEEEEDDVIPVSVRAYGGFAVWFFAAFFQYSGFVETGKMERKVKSSSVDF